MLAKGEGREKKEPGRYTQRPSQKMGEGKRVAHNRFRGKESRGFNPRKGGRSNEQRKKKGRLNKPYYGMKPYSPGRKVKATSRKPFGGGHRPGWRKGASDAGGQ